MKATLALMLLVAFASTAALGQLTFESETLVFTERAEAKKVEAAFAFRNETNAPITIDAVRTSCGCTTAKLSKKTYAPGESGEIEATFKFGFRTGAQRKDIVVKYAGDTLPDQKLILVVKIAETVTFDPKLVFWRVGSAPKTKTMRVKIEAENGVRIAKATSSGSGFAVSLKDEGKGRYAISVTPESTEHAQYSLITVETVSGDGGEPKSYQGYARVQ